MHYLHRDKVNIRKAKALADILEDLGRKQGEYAEIKGEEK